MKNIKLLQEFEESLAPKKEVHAADVFLEQHRKRMSEFKSSQTGITPDFKEYLAKRRKELEAMQESELARIAEEKEATQIDELEQPVKSALQPSTAFDEPQYRYVDPVEPIEGITPFDGGFSEVKKVSMAELSKMVADEPERFNLSPAELEREFMQLPPLGDRIMFSDNTQPNYDLMPQGMKEAQQRNGVRNYPVFSVKGAGDDAINERGRKELSALFLGISPTNPPVIPVYNEEEMNEVTSKLRTGDFEWEDDKKEKVIWVDKEDGRFTLSEPNEPTDVVKSIIERRFGGKPYYGTKNEPVFHLGVDSYNPEKGDCSIVVMKREDGIGEVVANYEARPISEEEFKEEVEKVTQYYNASSIEEKPVEINEFEIEEEQDQVDFFAEPEFKGGILMPLGLGKDLPPPPFMGLEYKPATSPMLSKVLAQSEPSNELINLEIDNNPYPKAYIGVDPGKKGGIVAITQNGIIGKWVIPLMGDNVDSNGIWLILSTLKEKFNCTLILEDVHSLFGMSASTNFSMGHTLGILDGIIAVSKIRLIRISPKTWQKSIWENNDMVYKPKKPEQTKPSVDTKATSINAAYRLYPNTDFRATTRSKNPWDGLTDACCLAEYGRRNNL